MATHAGDGEEALAKAGGVDLMILDIEMPYMNGIDFLRQAEVLARLSRVLPAEALRHAREEARPYECDGLSAYRQLPMLVALPGNEEEVGAVLSICHELSVPVVARGAGTGLSGGALPLGNGVLLSLARMMSRPFFSPGRVAR
mgnify:CR=1 FL=1